MDFICFLYCISSTYTDQHNTKKLGLTIHPVHRMRVYNTGDAPGIDLEKRYDGLWQVNAKTKSELIYFEKQLHNHFYHRRQLRANGNYTEWFNVTFEEVSLFMDTQPYVIRRLSLKEITIIHTKSEKPAMKEEMKEYSEETTWISEQKTHVSLKHEFFQTFLPLKLPRRIQSELWDLWEAICEKDQPYSGIVQWATGTGKTIALLMMFLLSANACKKTQRVFRGLLIAPTNDIFDTIIDKINKLSKWGIVICEGHNARLSSLHIPLDKSIIVTATHASLTELGMWDKLPAMTHCHYDEVHRITGEEFFTLLQTKLVQWNTQYLTGTSATPKTSTVAQHNKIASLFGNPLRILHKCDVDEAILEGWIAQPRFGVHIMSNNMARRTIIHGYVDIIYKSILDKQSRGLWKGGKVIVYLPFRSEVRDAVAIAKEVMPEWHSYTAVGDTDAKDDTTFVSDPADGMPRILFACERYREGSDIEGLEMTIVLVGNTIGANILLQIAGRALRNDYSGKEGWCIIVRPSDDETTEDDVFDSIVLQIMEFIGNDTSTSPSKDKIKKMIENFFGPVAISSKIYRVEETIHRIQAMYARKAFERSDPKEKYEIIRALNRDMHLTSRDTYNAYAATHPKFIEDPKTYFKDTWISWYHFLHVDTSSFPQGKMEWIHRCKKMGITSWDDYKKYNSTQMPLNPGEMYEDYMNWDKEFGIEEEIVW